MSIEFITILMFSSILVALFLGIPIAFAMGGVAVIFGYFLWGNAGLYMFASKTFAMANDFILVALPLFYLMANVLERSGIADDLYEMMYRWFGPLRGGLAMGTVVICTLFAAMSGISGAATVTMGLIALPSMLKRNYNKQIALGSIMAGGALGVLIPPSILMILYALFARVSVGRMFIGGVFPGLLLSGLFIAYIGIRCFLQPHMGPGVPREESVGWGAKLTSFKAVLLPVFIIIGVLGSIFTGIATPTEAAAVGAGGAILSAFIYRRLTWQNFKEAIFRTIRLTCMVMWIVLGATVFTAVYSGIGAPELFRNLILDLPVQPMMVIVMFQITYFILGCFLDPTGIIMLTVPIFVPVINALGFNPVWFGVLFVVNMEMAFLTPPYGVNLFYMRGVAPPGVTMGDIYRSIAPFVVLQGIGLVLVVLFPQIVLWLPSLMLD